MELRSGACIGGGEGRKDGSERSASSGSRRTEQNPPSKSSGYRQRTKKPNMNDELRRQMSEMERQISELKQQMSAARSERSERSHRTRDWVSRHSQSSSKVDNTEHPTDERSHHRDLNPLMTSSSQKPLGVDVPVDEIRNWVARKNVSLELPTFDGDPTQFPMFIRMFERSTEAGGYSDEENLLRLQKALKGEAKEGVLPLLSLPGSLPRVLSRLKRRYGHPDTIIKIVMAKLETIGSMGEVGYAGLERLASEVENAVTTVQLLGRSEYLFNPVLLDKLVEKLNGYLENEWCDHAAMYGDEPISLEIFNDWLQVKADRLGKYGLASRKPTQKQTSPPATQEAKDERQRVCLLCQIPSHCLEECKKFQKLTKEDKTKVVREKALCILCLKQGHRVFNCRSRERCSCGGKHHPLLHPENAKTQEEDTRKVSIHREKSEDEEDEPQEHRDEKPQEHADEAETAATSLTPRGRILLRVLPVTIYGPKNTVKTYAFLDNGSTVTMMEEKLAKELGLKGPGKPLRVSWSDDTVREERDSQVVSAQIAGVHTRAKQFQLVARTVKKLALPRQSVDAKSLEGECRRIADLEITSFEDAQPTILIGEDNWPLTIPLKVVHGAWNGPVATKTRLGWVVHGRAPGRPKGRVREDGDVNIHQLSHWIDESGGREEKILKELLSEYVMPEGSSQEEVELSQEDERAVAVFNETTRKVEGRWETGLLWKDNKPLPKSYDMALRRLYSLERKMDRNPTYAQRYIEKMEENIRKGYVSKLSEEEKSWSTGKEWYLPHLGVINPNKPTKLRVCFDASAQANGMSLNDALVTGPDRLVNLAGLLCRFREHPIAFSGDIKEMYPQIRIRHEDQMSQKFLWRGANRRTPPEEYAVRVMTFGAKCSPFSAQEVKNRNARELNGVDPKTVEAIINNHYMDDYLDCCATEEDAIHRVLDVIRVHRQGGFVMCNWITNSYRVWEMIPEELRTAAGSSVEMGESQKLLGMWWCPTSDNFHFKVQFSRIAGDVLAGDRRPTRREILKCVMSLYDPLGLLINITMSGKILLQDVWKLSPGWDDEITETLGKEWDHWIKRLTEVENLRIPRCVISKGAQTVELHIMCDASERAYGAAAYVRTQTANGVGVNLAFAKARVTPVKMKGRAPKLDTIPRLELQAAVTAAKIAKMLKKEHRLEFTRILFWSDSRIVLSWIRLGSTMKLQTFVQRRVREILETSTPQSWRWVPTKENCADDATRPTRKTTPGNHGRWLGGPEFLLKGEVEWPVEEAQEPEDDVGFVGVVQESSWEILPDVKRFSQWNRLIRTTAWIPRMASYWRSKDKQQMEELTVDELLAAERKLIKRAQADTFGEEIDALQKKRPLQNGSRLKSLDPFLDEEGLIRVGGRLEAAQDMSYEARHPILMASEHHLTKLLVMRYHKWARHQGYETILNALRQRFWITSARRAVRSSFNRCGLCQLKRAKVEYPKMAPLPKARVTADSRPFTRVGLDYFGPVHITVGRRNEKRYVALFTCLAVRAVHLEVAADLTSGATIMAIRRFAARRGMPAEIYSDNGTNFKRADKDLKEAIDHLNQEEILRDLAVLGIRWKFNCPAAPHMGGAWERMVRTVKKALAATLKEEKPREEVLTTALAEVEMVVNSRPLTHVSVDPADLTCLTPNHFLLGEANCGPICERLPEDVPLRTLWKRSQQLADVFWKRWVTEYVPTLNQRDKWTTPTTPLAVGDYVVIGDEGNPRGTWPRGVVTAVETARDGQVRAAVVKTAHGTFKRPATKIMKMTLEK